MTTTTDERAPLKVVINDTPCWYSKRIYSKKWQESDPGRVCAVCNKPLDVDKPMYMVINNYVLFPNVLIHESCVTSSLEDTTIHLMTQFKLFDDSIKVLIDNNKSWARMSEYVAETRS